MLKIEIDSCKQNHLRDFFFFPEKAMIAVAKQPVCSLYWKLVFIAPCLSLKALTDAHLI